MAIFLVKDMCFLKKFCLLYMLKTAVKQNNDTMIYRNVGVFIQWMRSGDEKQIKVKIGEISALFLLILTFRC